MDAVYKRVADKGQTISENILGKISEAVLNGLVYLHKMHHVIHRGMGLVVSCQKVLMFIHYTFAHVSSDFTDTCLVFLQT